MRITSHVGRVGGAVLGLAGVGLVLAGCGSSSASPAPSATPAPTTTAPGTQHKGAKGITGQITAENGSSWTVQTKAGKQYTVTIGSSTQFGTKKAPATQGQFTVGERVRVAGSVSGTTVGATRIAVPATPAGGPSTTAPASSPPTSPTTA